MASADNRPSQSLINAAVASLIGGLATDTITSGGTGFFDSILGAGSSSTDFVNLYFSSMLPVVSAAGSSIPKRIRQGPLEIDMQCLPPEFDYDFTNKCDRSKTFTRGNYPYERPCGSYRVALKVKDKFGNDNRWLGMTGTASDEWPVSYHGTAKHNALNIAEEGYKLSKGKRFRFGIGIYSTPELDVAKRYASKFRHEGTRYLCVLQNRVNPEYLTVIPTSETGDGTYWLSAPDCDGVDESELVRPYGICLFKQD